MDPNDRKFDFATARRPNFSDEEIAAMARAINEADRVDGTLELLDALIDEELAEDMDKNG